MDDTDYALGRTNIEYERLIEQAELMRPLTERVLRAAGIVAGMRVLDIGCGMGDVSFLVSELVGTTGSVMGVDLDRAVLRLANQRRAGRRLENISFREGDARSVGSEGPFDAVVGRFVLMYFKDPTDALRLMAETVRPGGIVAFHEWVAGISPASAMNLPILASFQNLISATFERSGARLNIGAELYQRMHEAGLDVEPRPLAEVACCISQPEVAYRRWASFAQSMLPKIVEYGVGVEQDVMKLLERLQREIFSASGLLPLSWFMVGQWARKPREVGSFEEEASDALGALDGTKRVAFRRNLPASAFEQVIAQLAEEAVRNSAKRLDLVLAGDIFDLHRTQLWFEQEGAQLRPYVSCANVAASRSLEDKILRVLDAIAAEEDVKESLAVFQRLTKQQFVQKTGNSKTEESFPVPVSLHYMPGNHDRLANATNRIRARVRELLGLPTDDKPFLHAVMLEDPRVLVRHGHEYDRFNFSVNYSGMGLPSSIPEHEYSRPCFGDFVTVQVASRLPNLFRKHHSAQAIATDATLEIVYVRLLEFDDLRPQSALLDFLLHIPGSDLSEDAIWTRLRPVAVQLLDEVSREEFLWHWLRQLRISWVIRLALCSRVWRLGLPLWLVRLVATRMSGADQGPARFAAQEEVIRRGEVRLVIAGHTHHAEVAHLRTTGTLKQYYVDTGTWRNRVLMTPTRDSFGRVKALTYVVVYASDEDPAHRDPAAPKQESFDYWSGFTQRWPLADTDA